MPATTPPRLQPHLPALDGIRGLAILMVMAYHYFPGLKVCNFGWTGVDLFFVLSGFLISSRLIPFINDPELLQKFYRNRFLRIVPLYFAFLLIFFGCWFLLSSPATRGGYPFYSHYWWGFLLFIQNWLFIYDFPPAAIHLNHFWSLATEEQFYLIFPAFVLLLRRRKKLLFAGAGLFLLILVIRCAWYFTYIQHNQFEKIYWNSFLRMDSFLAGLLLYLFYTDEKLHAALSKYGKYIFGVMLLVLLAGVIRYGTIDNNAVFFSTIGYSVTAIVYAGLIFYTASPNGGPLASFFKTRFLQFSGRISYGMYIFHWPVHLLGFVLINKVSGWLHLSFSETMIFWLNIVLSISTTLLLSHLSFRYFESYFLRWKVKPGINQQPAS